MSVAARNHRLVMVMTLALRDLVCDFELLRLMIRWGTCGDCHGFVTRVCDESDPPALEGSERSESVNLARVSVDLPTVEEAQGCIKERHELRGIAWATALLLIGAILPHARGGLVFGPLVLTLHNLHLHGQVVDFTDYHGADNRI
jgi:hypothetical protein